MTRMDIPSDERPSIYRVARLRWLKSVIASLFASLAANSKDFGADS
jgi:hypothetical protein